MTSMCIANDCSATDGVYFRRINIGRDSLRSVPLCREHYNAIRESQARVSWGTNY